MQHSSYSEFKNSLTGISGKALTITCRKILSKLNSKKPIVTEQGLCRDYRGLAELMGFKYNEIKSFGEHEDTMMKILEEWEARPDATLDRLIGYLEDMDRNDIISELIPLLEFIKYDAYVCYADDDMPLVAELAEKLESQDFGLKLFICARDMLAGCNDMKSNIELIKNRFRRVVIVLTPNFTKSPEAEFLNNFAKCLSVTEKHRILIPVILTPCELPPVLNTVSKIDLTKECSRDWALEKLHYSLQPDETKDFVNFTN